MRERVPMTDFARQWAEHVAASASPRMTDDQAEWDFWHAFMTRKTYAPEPSALQVLERLRPLLRARGVETALEVGPGWGSYTLALAVSPSTAPGAQRAHSPRTRAPVSG